MITELIQDWVNRLLDGTNKTLCTPVWRRQWQPTPVFLPGESQEWGNLVGCRLWGHTELDTTEVTQQQQPLFINSPNTEWDQK